MAYWVRNFCSTRGWKSQGTIQKMTNTEFPIIFDLENSVPFIFGPFPRRFGGETPNLTPGPEVPSSLRLWSPSSGGQGKTAADFFRPKGPTACLADPEPREAPKRPRVEEKETSVSVCLASRM